MEVDASFCINNNVLISTMAFFGISPFQFAHSINRSNQTISQKMMKKDDDDDDDDDEP